MARPPSIEEARQWFAEELRAVARLDDPRVVEAFATVPRERFVGTGPWRVLHLADGYWTTRDADPRHLYHNVLVAIDPARQLHNGLPSALAQWIEAVDIRAGDRVLHIGAGLGYYTAILAELAGPTGSVVGHEVDPALAARAEAALRPWPGVRIEASDASAPAGPFDAIFVNAGCTHPRAEWLAALAPGGRLVIPLTARVPGLPHSIGSMVRVDRRDPRWPASIVSQVGIYDCVNARDPALEGELRKLVGFTAAVKPTVALVEPHERGAACLVHLPGFCLQA